MKAIILAAGRGSRLKGITDDKPKCLVELHGRPLLAYQQEALTQAGITDISIVTGYRGEMLEGRGLTLFSNPRWAETNMVVSLTYAGAWLKASPCIVSYADIFYPASTVRALADCPADIALTYDRQWQELWQRRFGDKLLEDAETFRIDAQSRITEIGNRAQSVEEIQGQYMGLLKFTPAGWQTITRYLASLTPAECDRLSMTGLLQRLISAGVTVTGVPVSGGWGEVDTQDDLKAYA